jgi:hypothetical protein
MIGCCIKLDSACACGAIGSCCAICFAESASGVKCMCESCIVAIRVACKVESILKFLQLNEVGS